MRLSRIDETMLYMHVAVAMLGARASHVQAASALAIERDAIAAS